MGEISTFAETLFAKINIMRVYYSMTVKKFMKHLCPWSLCIWRIIPH